MCLVLCLSRGFEFAIGSCSEHLTFRPWMVYLNEVKLLSFTRTYLSDVKLRFYEVVEHPLVGR